MAFDAELAGKVFGLFAAELARWQEENARAADICLHMSCDGGTTAVPSAPRCDGVEDCADGQDEVCSCE